MGVWVRFLFELFFEEEVGEGGNGGVGPEVGKVCDRGDGCYKMDVALVRFTCVDEPNPPL